MAAGPGGPTVADARRPGAGVGCRGCGAAPRPAVWGFAANLRRDPDTIERKLAEIRRIGARMVRFDLDDSAEQRRAVRAAYPRMKAADPRSTILVGALSRREYVGGRPNEWPAAMYDKGLEGNFDATSVHPYTEPALPGEDAPAAYSSLEVAGPWDDRTPSMRELMVDHGDGDKMIWITAFSAPTGRDLGDVYPRAIARTRGVPAGS